MVLVQLELFSDVALAASLARTEKGFCINSKKAEEEAATARGRSKKRNATAERFRFGGAPSKKRYHRAIDCPPAARAAPLRVLYRHKLFVVHKASPPSTCDSYPCLSPHQQYSAASARSTTAASTGLLRRKAEPSAGSSHLLWLEGEGTRCVDLRCVDARVCAGVVFVWEVLVHDED